MRRPEIPIGETEGGGAARLNVVYPRAHGLRVHCPKDDQRKGQPMKEKLLALLWRLLDLLDCGLYASDDGPSHVDRRMQ